MTAIGTVGGPAGMAAPARAAPRGTGFAVPSPPPAAASAGASAIAPGAMAGLLAVQEGAVGDRRAPAARRAGQALLGGLSALQRAVLAGQGEATALAALRDLLGAMPPAEDPVLAAIALRCRIELARREAGPG